MTRNDAGFLVHVKIRDQTLVSLFDMHRCGFSVKTRGVHVHILTDLKRGRVINIF